MGSRQKREALQKGLRWRNGHWVPAAEVEKVEGERVLCCRVCGGQYPARLALEHVKECWGIEYASVGLIPVYPPLEAYKYHYETRPSGI